MTELSRVPCEECLGYGWLFDPMPSHEPQAMPCDVCGGDGSSLIEVRPPLEPPVISDELKHNWALRSAARRAEADKHGKPWNEKLLWPINPDAA